jgi:hypothetical protein
VITTENEKKYYEKIVITKGIIEVTRYERINTKGGGNREGNGEHKESNYKQTQKRRRTMIRQLITQNFDENSKFITLTFDNKRSFDIKDVKECNKAYKNFILRMKRRYPEIRYVTVVEFQDKNDRGAVHYHMICNLPYIKKKELSDIWDNGFVKINAIDKVDNVGAYVVKYMNKDIDDTRLQGLKAYNCSKGLKRPQELKSWVDEHVYYIRQVEKLIEAKSPSYASTYESDNAGTIQYMQYNLNRL